MRHVQLIYAVEGYPALRVRACMCLKHAMELKLQHNTTNQMDARNLHTYSHINIHTYTTQLTHAHTYLQAHTHAYAYL
jgi:hypothetical protein